MTRNCIFRVPTWIGIVLVFCFMARLQAEPTVRVFAVGDTVVFTQPVFEHMRNKLTFVYKQLGIELDFQRISSERSLILASEGLLDAQMLRVPQLMNDYPNLIKLPTPLAYAEVNLYCLTEQACQSDRIKKPMVIGYNRGILITKLLCEKIVRADCFGFYLTDDESLKPLTQGKIDAFIATELEILNVLAHTGQHFYKSAPIERVYGHHYVHERHAALVPQLDRLIKLHIANDPALNISQHFNEAMLATGRITVVDSQAK